MHKSFEVKSFALFCLNSSATHGKQRGERAYNRGVERDCRLLLSGSATGGLRLALIDLRAWQLCFLPFGNTPVDPSGLSWPNFSAPICVPSAHEQVQLAHIQTGLAIVLPSQFEKSESILVGGEVTIRRLVQIDEAASNHEHGYHRLW